MMIMEALPFGYCRYSTNGNMGANSISFRTRTHRTETRTPGGNGEALRISFRPRTYRTELAKTHKL